MQPLLQELTHYLIDSGMTCSVEDNEPATLRNGIKCEVLLNNLLDYMIGAGYVSTTKTS